MEIRILKLRLRNFKGVRKAEYVFSGQNARIEGPNGSGKSSVFDAFCWLLFGKDHRGQSTESFELKTIDPATGVPYPREEHWVEAELSIDGEKRITLRREWQENWVKPTGETDEVMRGHVTSYYVDGVNVGTKKAYDNVIGAWMNEDTFKMLTNPHYFIDDTYTPWKARRAALLKLVQDSPERQDVKSRFADVIDALSGRSLDDYRKRLALEKSANKKDLEILQNKIQGIKDALPAPVDEADIQRQLDKLTAELDENIAALKNEIASIDKAIAGGAGANAKRKAENDAIWAEITKVQLEMNNALAEEKNAAIQKNNARENALNEAKSKYEAAVMRVRNLEKTIANAQAQKKESTENKNAMAEKLRSLGVQYHKEKDRAFEFVPDTKCPYCGQEIPAATVEDAKKQAYAHYMDERKAAMDKIIAEATSLRTEIKVLDDELSSFTELISSKDSELAEATALLDKMSADIHLLQAKPKEDIYAVERQVRERPDFREMARKEQELRAKSFALTSAPGETDELQKEKEEKEQQISAARCEYTTKSNALRQALTVNTVRKSQLSVIAQMEQEASRFADAIAKGERMETRAAEYMKADVDSVSKALGNLFHVARWKMFDRTIEGGLVEMCEVTSPDGVPYRSMNDAMKILCGLDVIRAFSAQYGGLKAPIFIDNAEGILCDRFDNDAQIIRLVVKEGTGITVTKE